MRICLLAALVFPAAGLAADKHEAPSWSFSLTGTQYWLPHEPDFLLGIFTAGNGSLHSEVRWQYEDLRSLSAFAGWTFATGEVVHLEVTPIVGPIVGRSTGVIPGLELNLGWKWLNLYTEDEYFIDIHDSSLNYFYSWNELTATPLEFLTVGLVGQRTHTIHDSIDIQRGLLARLTWKGFTLGAYAFNIGTSDWYLSTGLTIER